MLFYILLARFILGVFAENEIAKESCYHLYPEELEPFVIPDAEMLPSICPKLIDYLECQERLIIVENSEIEPAFLGIKDVVMGICEENSNLQKDYLANVGCFRYFDTNVPPCDEAAQSIYLEYRLFITRLDTEDEDEEEEEEEEGQQTSSDTITYQEPYCMMSAYAVGCLATNILDRCGEAAQETFVEIVQRSKVLTQNCHRDEGDKLRSEFLDFLTFEKEHSHIKIFREVFDFRRKR